MPLPATDSMPTDTTCHLLADKHRLPVLLMDHWVSRRQRIHMLYTPESRHPYCTKSMREALDLATSSHGDRLILCELDDKGQLRLCFATASHPSTNGDR